jgi:SAM-dependent methyltransferase
MRKVLVLPLFAIVAAGLSFLSAPGVAQEKKGKLKTEIEVPFVPTDEKVVAAMLKLANVKKGETVFDLGCGDGRIVIAAVKDFGAGKGLGVDFNPERLADCKKRMDEQKLTAEQKKMITFKQGDVLKMTPEDFKDVDVVTLYLLPSVNMKLRPKLLKELRPGARVVSHSFDMGDWKADKNMEVMGASIFLWVIPPK